MLLLSLGALLRPLAPQRTAVRMSEWSADIAALGESLEARVCELETASCDPATFAAAMDELTELRKAGLKPGSSAYTAVVVEAAQRVDAQRWLSQQRVVQEGVQMVRDRDQAERDAAAAKAAAANSKAAALAAAAREAAGRKRAELLGYIFDEQAPAPAGAGLALARPPSVSTDAALGMLFNSGYDAEGMLALTATDLAQLKGIGASLTKALRRDGESVELLLRHEQPRGGAAPQRVDAALQRTLVLHEFHVDAVVLLYDSVVLQEVVVFCGIHHGCQLPPGTQKSLEGVGPGGNSASCAGLRHFQRLSTSAKASGALRSSARMRSASAPIWAHGAFRGLSCRSTARPRPPCPPSCPPPPRPRAAAV